MVLGKHAVKVLVVFAVLFLLGVVLKLFNLQEHFNNSANSRAMAVNNVNNNNPFNNVNKNNNRNNNPVNNARRMRNNAPHNGLTMENKQRRQNALNNIRGDSVRNSIVKLNSATRNAGNVGNRNDNNANNRVNNRVNNRGGNQVTIGNNVFKKV